MKKTCIVLTAACSLVAGATAYAGGIWNETGDAGQNGIGEAQLTIGSGNLSAIFGNLSSGSDVDLYCITITDADNFNASVEDLNFDPQLFLFNADGSGQVHNDDFGGLRSEITGQGVFTTGTYYIAVSQFNADPFDAGGEAIFSFNTWAGPDPQQRMPVDGDPLFSWSTSSGSGGDYAINLRGATFHSAPAPGALALLGLAGLSGTRRRRG